MQDSGRVMRLATVAVLVAGLWCGTRTSPVVAQQPAPPAATYGAPAAGSFALERAGGIDRWDEAMPLGNGLLGALVWGTGSTVRISLDRGDLWDLRTPDVNTRPDWTWATIAKLRDAGEFKQINALFDNPYEQVAYPTKLPGGRIELSFDPAVTITRIALDTARAEALVDLAGAEVRVRMDAGQKVGVMLIRGAQPTVALIRPAGLDKLGYAPPARSEGSGEWTLKQEAAAPLQYAVVVRREPPQRGSNRTRYAFTIDATRTGRDPLPAARGSVSRALVEDEAAARSRHLAWWKRFWNVSTVRLPDERLQRQYDLVRYFYGAASSPDAPPMPLQGVWTADAGGLPPWKGDFHHDLNTQMTYLAYPEAGLFDQGASFLNFLWDLLPRFRQFAREFYGIEGAAVPGVMALDGQPLGGWAQYSLSPTNGAWVAQSFYLHWKYTNDLVFLKQRAYPWCAEIGRGLQALLKPDASGRLKLPLSSSPEIFDNSPKAWLTPNSNYDLALMRFLFSANAEMADALGDAGAARNWRDTLAHLDPLLLDPATSALMVSAGLPFNQSHRHFSHAMAIYPLGTLNIDGTDADRKTITATLETLVKLGTSQWCGYSFAWMSAMAARVGQADRALQFLGDYDRAFIGPNGFHLNGDQTKSGLSQFTYRPFTLEGNFLAMQAVQEMLLQSWGGVLRVFPAVTASWQDVSFDRLRAEGGWVVSARRANGRTIRVEIRSTTGGTLRLKDPFSGAAEWVGPAPRREGATLVVALRPAELLIGQIAAAGRPGK